MNLSIQLISLEESTKKIITGVEGDEEKWIEKEDIADWEEKKEVAQRYLGNGIWKNEYDHMRRKYGTGGQTIIKTFKEESEKI